MSPGTKPGMILYAATSNKGKLAEFATSASSAGIKVQPLPNLAAIPEPIEDAPTFLGNAEIKAIAYSLAAPGLLVFADDSGLEVDALNGDPGVRSARFADDAGFGFACHPEDPERAQRDEGDEGPASLPGAPGPDSRTRPNSPTKSFGDHEPGAPRLASETWVPKSPTLSKDARNNTLLLSRLHALPANTPRTARFVCALALARDGEVLLHAHGTVEGQILDAPRGDNGFGYDPLFLIPSVGLTTAQLPADQKWSLSHRGNAFRALLAQLPHLDHSTS